MGTTSAGAATSALKVASVRHVHHKWDDAGAVVTVLAPAEAGKQNVVLAYCAGQGPGANGVPTVLFKSNGNDISPAMVQSNFGFSPRIGADRGVLFTEPGEELRVATLGAGALHVVYAVI